MAVVSQEMRVRREPRQLTCSTCRRSQSPFPEPLGLSPEQRILEELPHRLIDWVTELSYEKTCRLGREWLGDAPSPRTLHLSAAHRPSPKLLQRECAPE